MNYHRQSIRLRNYDYRSQGLYYLTICIQNRELYFENDDIKNFIRKYWLEIPEHFKNVELDEWIIMPNHLHGIIIINNDNVNICRGDQLGDHKGRPYGNKTMMNSVGVGLVPTHNNGKPRLGDIIGAFKSITTNYYIQGIKTKNWPPFNKRLWQRNYYEHIIRNEQSLNKIRQYIRNNPLNWETDRNNPKNYKIRN